MGSRAEKVSTLGPEIEEQLNVVFELPQEHPNRPVMQELCGSLYQMYDSFLPIRRNQTLSTQRQYARLEISYNLLRDLVDKGVLNVKEWVQNNNELIGQNKSLIPDIVGEFTQYIDGTKKVYVNRGE